jgi:hypothetical protein
MKYVTIALLVLVGLGILGFHHFVITHIFFQKELNKHLVTQPQFHEINKLMGRIDTTTFNFASGNFNSIQKHKETLDKMSKNIIAMNEVIMMQNAALLAHAEKIKELELALKK